MAVQKTADGVFFSVRDDGALESWGVVDEGNLDAKHVRQFFLRLPKYASPPVVTTSIFSHDSPGTALALWNYTFNDDAADITFCKVSAANIEIGVRTDLKFVCHFHAIGLPPGVTIR